MRFRVRACSCLTATTYASLSHSSLVTLPHIRLHLSVYAPLIRTRAAVWKISERGMWVGCVSGDGTTRASPGSKSHHCFTRAPKVLRAFMISARVSSLDIKSHIRQSCCLLFPVRRKRMEVIRIIKQPVWNNIKRKLVLNWFVLCSDSPQFILSPLMYNVAL